MRAVCEVPGCVPGACGRVSDWAAWCAVVQPDAEEASDTGGELELEVTDAAEQEEPRSAA